MFMEKVFWDKANQQAGTLNVPFQQLTVKRYMTYFMNWNMSNVSLIKSVAFRYDNNTQFNTSIIIVSPNINEGLHMLI